MKRFFLLSVLVGVVGCATPVDVASDEAAVVARPDDVQVSLESSTDAPSRDAKVRFEQEQLPRVREMLAKWNAVRPLNARLRIAFVDSSRVDNAVIAEIYGADYATDARALLARVEAAGEPEIEALAREVACRFPGLGRPPILEGLNQVLALPQGQLARFLVTSLGALLDPTKPANEVSALFGRTSATTYASPGNGCGFILFGERPTNGVVELRHEDTVLHEVGHFVDLATRPVVRDRGEPPAAILTEALGDVLSHAFTQRTCHKTRPTDADCVRTMTDAAGPIASDKDPYANGQAIRVAAWKLVANQDVSTVGKQILDARDQTLASLDGIDPTVLLRKATPAERAILFAQDERAATTFAAKLAAPR